MIDLSQAAAQDALAQAAAETSFRAEDLAGWVQVASLEDGQRILEAYRLAGTPMDVATFDRLMAALDLFARLVGDVVPAVALANDLRAAL